MLALGLTLLLCGLSVLLFASCHGKVHNALRQWGFTAGAFRTDVVTSALTCWIPGAGAGFAAVAFVGPDLLAEDPVLIVLYLVAIPYGGLWLMLLMYLRRRWNRTAEGAARFPWVQEACNALVLGFPACLAAVLVSSVLEPGVLDVMFLMLQGFAVVIIVAALNVSGQMRGLKGPRRWDLEDTPLRQELLAIVEQLRLKVRKFQVVRDSAIPEQMEDFESSEGEPDSFSGSQLIVRSGGQIPLSVMLRTDPRTLTAQVAWRARPISWRDDFNRRSPVAATVAALGLAGAVLGGFIAALVISGVWEVHIGLMLLAMVVSIVGTMFITRIILTHIGIYREPYAFVGDAWSAWNAQREAGESRSPEDFLFELVRYRWLDAPQMTARQASRQLCRDRAVRKFLRVSGRDPAEVFEQIIERLESQLGGEPAGLGGAGRALGSTPAAESAKTPLMTRVEEHRP